MLGGAVSEVKASVGNIFLSSAGQEAKKIEDVGKIGGNR